MPDATVRVGIDVGGTFTDFVLAAGAALHFHKEPSVPLDPSQAVERGLATLLSDHAIAPDQVELVVHGTTIGLNAIIQRRGACMALVVSRGNRDLFELARLRMPSSYDVTEPREAPLVPRDLVFEIGARIKSDGTTITPPDPAEIDDLAHRLAAANIEAVAIVLLNAYRTPDLERQLAARLQDRLPNILVTTSGTIWPEIREYERGLVAGLNAYIHPLMAGYFQQLETRVTALGLRAPIHITANNGGTLSLATARDRPIDTVLSGPASGVVASNRIANDAAMPAIVTFDMGGTSADIAICQTGTPEFTTSTFVGDFPLMMPVVNVGAIGAGGGSLIWVDAQGLLKVGPVSAGAAPGPACYGRGGTEATVTDCYVCLGIVDPAGFLGGRMTLDRAAAVAAMDAVAERLGLHGEARALAAAESALRVASAKMATEITRMLATAGVDPRGFALVAYGGAGPTHANLLAEAAQLTTVLIPTAPGTFCALGAVLADIRRDYVRTARHRIGAVEPAQNGWPAIAGVLAELEAEARAWIAREGALIGQADTVVSFDMRYLAQAYELEIHVPAERRDTLDDVALAGLFHAEHERRYGFAEPAVAVQTTTVRLGVIGRVTQITLPDAPSGKAPLEPHGHRTIRHAGTELTAAIYHRADIARDDRIAGPAIVEQPDTTVFILPGWTATADRLGTLHLVREPSA